MEEARGEAEPSGLTYNIRCLICDLAFEMGMSEKQFYDKFDFWERHQLLATYQSKMNRQTVMARYPVQTGRRATDGAT